MSPSAGTQGRSRPSFARAAGVVALGWALVALVLQAIVAAQASSLPATVHVLMPAYGAGQSTVTDWDASALIPAGWALTVALIAVAVLGILFGSAKRIWIAIALVIVAAFGSWLTVAFTVSSLLQVGTSTASDDTLRAVVDPIAIVAILAVFVTVFFGVRLISLGTLGKTRA